MVGYFIAACLVTLGLTPLIRRMALSQQFVATPSKDRWHKRPTALMGGVAIFLGVAFPLLFTSDITTLPGYVIHSSNPFFVGYADIFLWFCIAYFFFLGLWDDLRQLAPHIKLTGQIIGAAAFAFAGFRLNWFHSLTLDTLVTMVWIVTIVNAVNLIDNMDGLCAGTGIIAALFFVVLLPGGNVTAVCLAGALAGFLVYNFNPASIFMGDCGSMLTGFVLAAAGIHYSGVVADNLLYAVAVPMLVLAVPILDTVLVSLVRRLSGRKASTGGRDHTSHRLVAMGFSEKETVLILYGASLVAGTTGFFVTRNDALTAPAIVIPFCLTVFLMVIYIARLRIYKKKEFSVLREKKLARLITEAVLKGQSVLVVFDFFLVAFCYYLAYRIRFDNQEFLIFFRAFLTSLPVVIICKFAAFIYLDVYRNSGHYMGFTVLLDYVKAAFAGSLLSIAAVTYLFRFESFSKGVFIIDFLLTLGLLMAVRGSFRVMAHIQSKRQMHGVRVLIYGAGRKGEWCVRQMLDNPDWQLNPIGFIDRDPGKKGKKIYGFPVLGSLKDLAEAAETHDAAGIVVSASDLSADEQERLARTGREHNLFLKRFVVTVSDFDFEQELT
jgi:UDP-GlcNAc:undecaprenyl-phosphate/decaprenyl-phosphate GlcNAc-1-phosphate transferase